MNKSRILIVDDEIDHLDDLGEFLTENGFEVNTATNGEEAIAVAKEQDPDLVVLDVRMPGMSGFEVCRRLRQTNSSLPIIFLSALRQEMDKVRGLNLGGDDYIAKPYSLMELLARINSLLRRTKDLKSEVYWQFGEVKVNLEGREVIRSGQTISFAPKEFDLLCYLVEHQGKVLSRDDLLEAVWKHERNLSTRTVDIHILNLRKKLESDPSNPQYFLTVHGVGYKFISDN